jgi:hypothetical protein
MNLKKLAMDQLKKAAVKEATNKILPMDGAKPKMGWKVKLAGILATIAAVAGAVSQYLGG